MPIPENPYFNSTHDYIEFLKRASEDPSYDVEVPIAETRPVGRPPKTVNPKRLDVRIEAEILDEFTRKAHALGMSQADLVRKIIEDVVNAEAGTTAA